VDLAHLLVYHARARRPPHRVAINPTLIAGNRSGVFAALRDLARFARVCVDRGAVAWPGALDLAPDTMYDETRANGSWIVE